MSATYKLDGSFVTADPINNPVPIRDTLDYDHAGAPIFSPFYKTTLEFNPLKAAEFAVWYAVCDGAAHSILMPTIGNPTSTYTTYTGVFLVLVGGYYSTGLYTYGVQIEVRHIT